LTDLLTPVSLSGFTASTLPAFASDFHRLGFEPLQGVSGNSNKSQSFAGPVLPGSMISVQLASGDMAMSADGTVTYVDGKHLYAFGHRFLDGGATELPFSAARVVALLPNLNTSFKISEPAGWIGTILSDRSTGIAGEIGYAGHTIPLTVSVNAPAARHEYHVRVIDDRLLTPFITQAVLFSVLDATERSLGAGTLRVRGKVDFEGSLPSLAIRDIYVSDSGLPQQASANAAVPLGFVLGAGFRDVRVKQISFEMEPVETKKQLQILQVWTGAQDVRPGEAIQVQILLSAGNGESFTRSATYRVPAGAPAGPINLSVGDASSFNFLDFGGLTTASIRNASELVDVVNRFRGSESAYLRVWRSEPSFNVAGQVPGRELSDPPPSVALLLASPFSSTSAPLPFAPVRGSTVEEIAIPVDGYVVGPSSKTVQVEVKE
jgi:hypothetical protein